jgi:hypothetical protein
MYPKRGKKLSAEQLIQAAMFNPDEVAARGNWSDPAFLENVTDLNGQMSKTQFADFHSHGWVFRAVFRHDKQGRILDRQGNVVPDVTPAKLQSAMQAPELAKELHKRRYAQVADLLAVEKSFAEQYKGVPVHYMDVHMEKGMHCVDCHFVQDMHGNTRLQMEVRAGCEIQCIDCHGSAAERPTLRTTGPAAYTSAPDNKGRDLAAMRTPFGKRRFERFGERLFQNSMVEEGLSWEVTQTADTVDPAHAKYNQKSHLAKTVRFEGEQLVWGGQPKDVACPAHTNKNMHCVACH